MLKRREGQSSAPPMKTSRKKMKKDHIGGRRSTTPPAALRDKKKSRAAAAASAAALRAAAAELPVSRAKRELLEAAHAGGTLIVVGETGSGKTTQLPQFLAAAAAERARRKAAASAGASHVRAGVIAVTQPRRVAAMTVARRVAAEMGCAVGEDVGYCIRFEDVTSPRTRIKYMTDGMLLREALLDPMLRRYSAIVLDEAHERTVHTDVLFGLVKGIKKRRPQLTLVVMSATLDTRLFASYFPDPRVVRVPGRQFPVRMRYTAAPERDFLDAALVTVLQVHLEEPPGDVLVFLPGQEDIETLAELLEERARRLPKEAAALLITPIYAALPPSAQLAVFARTPERTRKVVLATNIAETSITISGVRYVIDPGLVKVRGFMPRTGLESLQVVPVSKAQAWQRAGRAGREAAGSAFRLYTEDDFEALAETTVPEILRCSLATVVLQLTAMGIRNVLAFDFLQPPSRQALARGLRRLYHLAALDDEGQLTALGKRMAELPLEPMFGKLLLTAPDYGCTEEVLTVIAMLSVDNVFHSPREKRAAAAAARERFRAFDGDHITLLRVYDAWQEAGCDESWCNDHFINPRAMRKAADVRQQLADYARRFPLEMSSLPDRTDTQPLRRALLAACFLHTARLQPPGSDGKRRYKAIVDRQLVHIHPSSVLFGRSPRPDCLLYNETVVTSKQYMRCVTRVDASWLPELAPKFFAKLAPALTPALPASLQSRQLKAESKLARQPARPLGGKVDEEDEDEEEEEEEEEARFAQLPHSRRRRLPLPSLAAPPRKRAKRAKSAVRL